MSDKDTIKKLRKLAPMNARPLQDQIYEKILVSGEQFTEEKKDECKEGIELFGKLFVIHREFSKKHPFRDMLGEYLMEYGGLNPAAGQFFTPYQICDFMTKTIISKETMTGEPQTILDPASGSGRFMLSTAKHYAKEVGMFNFLFTNIDIDRRMFICCTMNAILNGIPSINIHGDALGMKYWGAYAVIPTNAGVGIWRKLDPEMLMKNHRAMQERSRQPRGMEKFIGKIKKRDRSAKFKKFTIKPKQKKLFGEED